MATTLAATITTSIGPGPGLHSNLSSRVDGREKMPASALRGASSYRGLTASEWAAKFRHRTRQLQHARAHLHQARRVLMQRPTVVEAVNLACAIYGNCGTLWSLARCESGLSPYARNSSSDASGLFQFMPSTFASTPFGRLSIWSPYANALAAGWMIQHGRRGEWVC